jgi:colanic acid biosynthesis glycosyl transferase WcaI
MKILVASPFFHPEHSGSSPYSTDLAVYLAECGHDVTVVTGFPFYPQWKKRLEHRRKLFAIEQYRGVRILRGYLYVPASPSALKRMIHELTFTIFACLNLLRAGNSDCLIVSAAPLPLQLASLVFMRLWGIQLVIHIQDLQTDAALSLGMVKHSFVPKLLLKLEGLIYRYASWVATITPRMKANLRRKGVPEDKLAVIPNWISVAEISELSRRTLRGRLLFNHPIAQGKFTVAYAGNIGAKQGLEVLVDLAEASQTHKNIHFFIIGEGSHRLHVEEYAKSKALTNITFLPFMTEERYIEMLQDIDVSFVSQKPGSGDVFFPGKLLGIMAMHKPLLISADQNSELAMVISNAKCGLVASPGDSDSLLQNLTSLCRSPDLRESLGRNGYEHVKSYDRERVLSRFLDRISQWNGDSSRS